MTIEPLDPVTGSPALADPSLAAPGTTTAPDWEDDGNVYKQRFNDYRSLADRHITEASELRRAVDDLNSGDPQLMRAAVQRLNLSGLEIEEPEPPVFDDPAEELRAQLEELRGELGSMKGQLTARQEADRLAAQTAELDGRLDALGLKGDARDTVLGRAFTLPAGEDGLPDVAGAHAAVQAWKEAEVREWAASKRAPTSIGPGATATQQRSYEDMVDSSGALTREGLEYAASRLADS